MNTPFTPLRRRRCEKIITAADTFRKVALDQIAYLAWAEPERFVAMFTDEAVESLAFKAMRDRVFRNGLHARNRAIVAGRVKEQQGV